MKLKKLLKGIPISQVKGSKEIEVTGICGNSKFVAPGNLFVARKGRSDDGARYIPEAIAAGAVAVLTDIYDPSLKNVTQIVHPDITSLEGLIAARYYQFPGRELFMVAITGTNGKTTTGFITKHLLDRLNTSCGLVSTIEYIIGEHRYQAVRTTPDVSTNHKMLREMVFHGCQSAVMEVSSHALDQGRVDYIDYDVAIFTNLSQDHLDYHQTMENYCHVKNKLFRSLSSQNPKKEKPFPKFAIVNADNSWSDKILEGCQASKMTFAIHQQADVQASNIELTSQGTSFDLAYQGEKVVCNTPLVGRYNIYNCLAAICVGLSLGYPLKKVAEILQTFPSIAGRLEPISNALGLKIYIDFAHSEEALKNVLECLQELKKGRMITVFGCGGDRDQDKRPKMGEVVESLSDFVIVTTDNPRSEDPAAICQQIAQGFKNRENHLVELDRYRAIEKAIDLAMPQDIILIAGKGHERYQVFSHKTVEFDDRKAASEICQKKKSA